MNQFNIKIVITSVLISFITILSANAQRHTFTKIKGEYKDFATNQSYNSVNVDNITIENMGGGLYKLIDSQDSIIFKYSHIKDSVFFYKSVNGLSSIMSKSKLSTFANGFPGSLAIDLQPSSILLIYNLGN